MINPGVLTRDLVTALRSIPELVAEVDGDATKIRAYIDRYPGEASIARAIWKLENPGILVMYQGYGPGRAKQNETWRHQVAIYLKLRGLETGQDESTYYKGIWLLVNGVPSAGALRIADTEVNADCFQMDVPSCNRRSLLIDDRGTTIDYWEFQATFTEKGDA